MNNKKIRYRNLRNNQEKASTLQEVEFTDTPIEYAGKFSQDPQIFLLNNILMSIQFFENFDRDIELLRGKWFKETALPKHHKKCFFADSLHKLVGSNLKFVYRHGVKKHSEEFLHPFRIFVNNDNIESAYDPTALKPNKMEVFPNYQFVVRPCDNNRKDKSGFVLLVELTAPNSIMKNEKKETTYFKDNDISRSICEYDNNIQKDWGSLRKSVYTKSLRKLTKTEKIIAFQNKKLKYGKLEKTCILKNDYQTNDTIPNNGFYFYSSPEKRLYPKQIYDFRMNFIPQTSHSIPRKCFQTIEIKKAINNRKRDDLKNLTTEGCFSTKIILNAAAFKGYFCDILIERLADPLGLDPEILEEGIVHDEFIIINNKETTNYITPVVEVKDWHKFLKINKKGLSTKERGNLKWPTDYMEKIISNLPCNLVPSGYLENLEENLDYEKEWKIIFPKAEEYLLLHMMHAHLRCYFFALIIYKSFIELEINRISFGPKHLLHLLFWRVQKNFTAWPEDRPGETLLKFLKTLYKKLQNKTLYDFFLTNRNLFENSLTKDLHKVQAILKMIIENPVPYIMKAIRNITLQDNFYLTLDISQLNMILTDSKIKKKYEPKNVKEKKTVSFEDDQERQWRKDVVKQIQIERKLEQQKEISKLSVESINTEETIKNDFFDSLKWCEILEVFVKHFVQMGIKSTENEAVDQSQMYLLQSEKLIDLLCDQDFDVKKLCILKHKTYQLSKKCDELKEGKPSLQKPDSNETDKTTKKSQAGTKLMDITEKSILTREEIEKSVLTKKEKNVEVSQASQEKFNEYSEVHQSASKV